jgi:fimbrial chaperone protein
VRGLILGLLASTAVAGLPSMPAHAGTFSISPIRLDLSAQTRSAALTVRNDDREVMVQAEVMLWEQVDGQDKLTQTRDLLVSPAVFTLPPEGSQLVRVALRNPPAETGRELSYRLILQEVPQSADPHFSGLQVALRLSVPVFVAIAGTTGPALAWSASASPEGQLTITAQNSGDVHARIHGFSVVPAAGDRAPLAQPVASYLLPGESRSWNLSEQQGARTSPADWRRLRLTVTTDDGESETELDAAGE